MVLLTLLIEHALGKSNKVCSFQATPPALQAAASTHTPVDDSSRVVFEKTLAYFAALADGCRYAEVELNHSDDDSDESDVEEEEEDVWKSKASKRVPCGGKIVFRRGTHGQAFVK